MKFRKAVGPAIGPMLLVISFFVSGCASTYYSNHKPTEFTQVPDPKSFVIKRPVISQKNAESWGQVDSTQGILPGTYVSALENQDGKLYFGNGRSYFVKYANRNSYYLRAGGFWMPKAKSAAPKLFYIVDLSKIVVADSLEDAIEGNTATEGVRYDIPVVLNAFIKSEDGHIVLVPTEVGFTEKLSSELQPTETPKTGTGR